MSFNLDLSGLNIEIIPEYVETKNLIENNEPIIFITGGAGTGKSTFIKWLLHEFKGKVLLSAPTAVAALNIKGKTLHSMCLLPPAWIVDEDLKYLSFRKDIKKAKILVIDEISMVNANLLDAVDSFLQLNRKSSKPFGGLITVFVGDLFQLPPVVSEDVRELFADYYDSPWFYSANCVKEHSIKTICLKKTFRQSDDEFITHLLNIREGKKVVEALEYFNERCPVVDNPDGKGIVRMCPKNATVDRYNMKELKKINSPSKTYLGEMSGSFSKSALPCPLELILKVGAQVMFTQNDADKRWINGTVGEVVLIEDDIISVKLYESNEIVQVGRAKWADYKYSWSEIKKKIERTESGSYIQFPLTLAWACTIHKSQGKTISHIYLDLGTGAFESGQTYVALSRCPTVEGIMLSRCIEEDDVLVNEDVKDFYSDMLNKEKKNEN